MTTTEIISAVEAGAVVISVIILAIQIQQNTKAIKSSTYQSIISGFAELESRISQDKTIARIYYLAKEDYQKLKKSDLAQASQLMSSFFNLYENLFYQKKNKMIDQELWVGWCMGLMRDLEKPGVQYWWKRTSKFYSKDFRDYLNSGNCLK